MRSTKLFFKKVAGFTLNEMLVVLAIIGALLLIAYPNLMPLITSAKSQEAKINLKHIANLQSMYRYTNSTFSMELEQIGFETPKSQEQGGTALYEYQILQAEATEFKAQARAVVDFDGDGVLNLWEINQDGKPTEVVKD